MHSLAASQVILPTPRPGTGRSGPLFTHVNDIDAPDATRAKPREATMAGILLWLMGVPLAVIVLLYLIF
jgi:hypothetical protein